MGDFSFPRSHHLRRSSDFQVVYRQGRKGLARGLVIYRLSNNLGHLRLGLSVSRKFGNAVRRNRIKRLIREAVRLNRDTWKLGGLDVVVIARKGADRYGLSDVTSDLTKTLSGKVAGRG